MQEPNRLPPIEESLNRIFEAMLCELFTGMPAVIETYDPDTLYCSVKPTLKRVFLNDDDSENVVGMPVVKDVPVAFPQGGGGYLTFPLKQGDRVWLWVSQRSLDAWKETDGKTPLVPGDARRHHLTDVVAYPGVGTYKAPLVKADPNDVVLGLADGSVEMHMEPGGNFWLKSPNVSIGAKGLTGDNAVARLSDLKALADVFNNHVQPTPFGPTGAPVTPQNPTASSTVFVK